MYIGQIQNYRYTKSGFFLDKNQVYEGEFESGLKDGYGKLTNTIHKFIGNFKNNLYQGHGQLVNGKDIYVGQFKEGMRHGYGKNQGDFNYDGLWMNNRPEGNGVLKLGDEEFIGKFKKGEVDEESQVTIRFENGTMYKGFTKDKKPNGKGYHIDENGTKFGIFKDGKLI